MRHAFHPLWVLLPFTILAACHSDAPPTIREATDTDAPETRPPLGTTAERLAHARRVLEGNPRARLVARLELEVRSEGELERLADGAGRIRTQRGLIAGAQLAWMNAVGLNRVEARPRLHASRPYLSFEASMTWLDALTTLAFDRQADRLIVETNQGPLAFDVEADRPLGKHAAGSGPPCAPGMEYALALVQADRMHDEGHFGYGVRIAVLDDGVAPVGVLTAAGGASRVTSGASFTVKVPEPCGGILADHCLEKSAGEPLATPSGDANHGTKVAAVASASQSSWTDPLGKVHDTAGIAPLAEIVAVRIEDATGDIYADDVGAALAHIHDQRLADVVNISLGSSEFTTPGDCVPHSPVEKMFDEYIGDLWDRGIPVVVSAGNDNNYVAVGFPACLEKAIAVAATDAEGKVVYNNWCAAVELAAPGLGLSVRLDEHEFSSAAGSSMAAPQVAAAFGLLKSAFPDHSIAQIRAALLDQSRASISRNGVTKPLLHIGDALDWLRTQTPEIQETPQTQAPGGG
jgi:hypothetical protein